MKISVVKVKEFFSKLGQRTKHNKRKVTVILGAAILLASYQNCSQRMNMAGNALSGSSNNSGTSTSSLTPTSGSSPSPNSSPGSSPAPSTSPTPTPSPAPISTSGFGLTDLSLAFNDGSACAITPTGVLKCWGSNQNGTVGNGQTTPIKESTTQGIVVSNVGTPQSTPEIIDAGTSYKKVSMGYSSSCGLTTTGVLKCWGGALGVLNSKTPATSTDFPGTYIDVADSYQQTCAITTAGALTCLGGFNQGPPPFTTSSITPFVLDAGTTYQHIAMAFGSACGITTTNVLKCWGYMYIGSTTPSQSTTPIVIDAGTSYASVSLGEQTACGVTTAGVLKCWGSSAGSNVPIVFDSGTTYSQVSAGNGTTCGVTTTGVLKCWGLNNSGQFGDGTTVSHPTPEVIDAGTTYYKVSTGSTFAEISIDGSPALQVAGSSTCGITTTGTLKCWGDNAVNELGDGTTVNHLTPEVIDAGTTY